MRLRQAPFVPKKFHSLMECKTKVIRSIVSLQAPDSGSYNKLIQKAAKLTQHTDAESSIACMTKLSDEAKQARAGFRLGGLVALSLLDNCKEGKSL